MWIENRKDVRTGKGNCQSKVAIAKLHLGHSDSQYVFTIAALCDVDIGGMGKTQSVPAQNGKSLPGRETPIGHMYGLLRSLG
jgi:hypothetical protein